MTDPIAEATELLRKHGLAAFIAYRAEEAQEFLDAAEKLSIQKGRLRDILQMLGYLLLSLKCRAMHRA